MKKIKLLFLLPIVYLVACSYSMSASPYYISGHDISVNIPIAENKSRYGDLGPMLSEAVVERLASNNSITVSEGALHTLHLTVEKAYVDGGAWQVKDNSSRAIGSASRVFKVEVEAVYEITEMDGSKKPVKVKKFTSQHNYLVSDNQSIVSMRETKVLEGIVTDLSQKIALTMFSEF